MPAWHDDGTTSSRPTGTGGYGLYQLTYAQGDSSYIMPRDWIWNWQSNAIAVNQEWQPDLTKAQNLYAGLTSNYPGTIPNRLQFSGLEAIVITYYNGMGGGSITKVPINGVPTSTCWYPNGNGGWTFLPNGQNYVDTVNGYAP